MALDLDTARVIVDAACADVSSLRNIENSRLPPAAPPPFIDPPMGFVPPRLVEGALERLQWAGGARNVAMLLTGGGPKDEEFVRLSCVGIAQATKAAIMASAFNGKLPKVQSSFVAERMVNGYAHKGTGVAMKNGKDYVFDWWPTLNPRNPLVSSKTEWRVAGKSVEYIAFKGLP